MFRRAFFTRSLSKDSAMNEMRRLDLPDPVDNRRSSSGRMVRFFYGASVICMGLFLIGYFGKPLVILQGPGIVTAKRYVISAPYTSHVNEITVSPGQKVNAGDEIAFVSSFEVEKYISDLLKVVVDEMTEETTLSIKVAVAKATRESSMKRLSAANDSVDRFEGAPNPEAASLPYRAQVYREQALAMLAVSQSDAEGKESAAQLSKLAANMNLIGDQLRRIRQNYNEGRLLAPISGVLSARMAESGETILAGGIIAEVFDTGDIYIDWTIPALRMVQPRVGDVVRISNGTNTFSGTISELFSLSADFGGGNKSIMSDAKMGQIARVRADNLTRLVVLNTEVSVRMNYVDGLRQLREMVTP